MSKADEYKKLVEDVKASGDRYDKAPWNITLMPPEIRVSIENGRIIKKKRGVNFCNEINLYTYWQGLGYGDKHPSPKIKYLVVAQDWGNAFNIESTLFDRIVRINDGERDIQYRRKGEKSVTDDNLTELFTVLGYGKNGKKPIDEQRYDELFFTNFCLGYRTGTDSGGMYKDLMMVDKEYFRRLYDILEPENTLCLGRLTFECVYETITDKSATDLDGFQGNYNNFIEHKGIVTLSDDKRIYALAHCGAFGTMNRNKGMAKNLDPLSRQREDWERIKQ